MLFFPINCFISLTYLVVVLHFANGHLFEYFELTNVKKLKRNFLLIHF